MKLTKIAVVLAATLSLALVGVAQKSPAHGAWKTDLAKAQAEAKKTGKLVMVDFNAAWCGPCKLYKRDVFPKPAFIKATKDVILVDIDTDKQPQLAQKFKVQGIPDIRFLAPNGREVGKVVGYGGEKALLDALAKAKAAIKK